MFQRQFDRRGCADVRRHSLAMRVRNVRGHCQFVFPHDGLVRTRSGDGLIAGHIQLDRVHPFAYQRSASACDFLRPVDYHRDRFAIDMHAPLVAQVAGVGQLGGGGQQPWSRRIAGIDRVACHHVEARLRRPAAQTRSESGLQHHAGMAQRLQHVLFGRNFSGIGDIRLVQERQVRMTVDQSGNDGMTRHIDACRGNHPRWRLPPYLGDAVALHQNVGGGRGLTSPVPNTTALQQHAFHGASLRQPKSRTSKPRLYDASSERDTGYPSAPASSRFRACASARSVS